MAEEIGETEVVEQSTVLSEGEVEAVVNTPEEGEVTLPSDEAEFEVPEKFKGKSLEDVIKSYQELEKFKSKDIVTEEEAVKESTEGEEPSKEPTKIEKGQYQKYADALDKNGELSEEEYTELEKVGYSKEQVDEEIEYRQYRKDKSMKDVLEPLGGGKEKFKEVSDWANENKTPEEIKTFNEALAGAGKLAQQALLKGLYAEHASSNTTDTVLHTNSSQTTSTKGYASEAEFFKDISSNDYKTHKSFAKAVEAKLAKTNTEGWSID